MDVFSCYLRRELHRLPTTLVGRLDCFTRIDRPSRLRPRWESVAQSRECRPIPASPRSEPCVETRYEIVLSTRDPAPRRSTVLRPSRTQEPGPRRCPPGPCLGFAELCMAPLRYRWSLRPLIQTAASGSLALSTECQPRFPYRSTGTRLGRHVAFRRARRMPAGPESTIAAVAVPAGC